MIRAATKWIPRRRRAVVLVIVLVVVVVLALAAYSFATLMIAQQETTVLAGEQLQAKALADSGIEAVRLFLTHDEATLREAGGTFDNPNAFRGVLVVDDLDPARRGRFTVLAPAIDTIGHVGAGVRYGLEDESTKLNLNALITIENQMEGAGRDLLMAMPGMTIDTADAILDWLDEDDEVREYGAELEHYSGLDPPYAPKNGPLDSVEELLLVRGVLPELLFGLDVNRNNMVDVNELNGYLPPEVDNTQGEMDRGWSAYLTLWSMEANLDAQGQTRIFLNQDDVQTLHDELSAVFPPDWVQYIVAYRLYGPYGGGTEAVQATGELDLTARPRGTFTQVLDLIGSKVRLRFQGEDDAVVIASPFPEGIYLYLPQLLDNVTVNPAPIVPGRINVNQASRVVLRGIPNMTEEMVEQIINLRELEPTDTDPNLEFETWLLTRAVVSLEEMRLLQPFVTTQGSVYRAQVVGYFEEGTSSARAEVIIDDTGGLPQLVFWRDLGHLGRGYALETLGVEYLEESATAGSLNR